MSKKAVRVAPTVSGQTGDPANPYKSGRGHDFNGGGIGIGNGQLAQAQDRNFEACFARCRRAVRNIANVNPAYAVAALKELQLLVSQVAGMLDGLEHHFDEGTAKTIVSLKQLCIQIEAADAASAKAAVPLPLCARICGGGAAVERQATAGLAEITKTVKTYAVSLLLEHGYRATDLAGFAKKRGEAVHSSTPRLRWAEGQADPAAEGPRGGLAKQLSEGTLAEASSGVMM